MLTLIDICIEQIVALVEESVIDKKAYCNMNHKLRRLKILLKGFCPKETYTSESNTITGEVSEDNPKKERARELVNGGLLCFESASVSAHLSQLKSEYCCQTKQIEIYEAVCKKFHEEVGEAFHEEVGKAFKENKVQDFLDTYGCTPCFAYTAITDFSRPAMSTGGQKPVIFTDSQANSSVISKQDGKSICNTHLTASGWLLWR